MTHYHTFQNKIACITSSIFKEDDYTLQRQLCSTFYFTCLSQKNKTKVEFQPSHTSLIKTLPLLYPPFCLKILSSANINASSNIYNHFYYIINLSKIQYLLKTLSIIFFIPPEATLSIFTFFLSENCCPSITFSASAFCLSAACPTASAA